jgi:hypothetical protein
MCEEVHRQWLMRLSSGSERVMSVGKAPLMMWIMMETGIERLQVGLSYDAEVLLVTSNECAYAVQYSTIACPKISTVGGLCLG